MEAVMSKLRETEDLLEAVQTEKGNSEAQVTNVQHESTRKSSVQWILNRKRLDRGTLNLVPVSTRLKFTLHIERKQITDNP